MQVGFAPGVSDVVVDFAVEVFWVDTGPTVVTVGPGNPTQTPYKVPNYDTVLMPTLTDLHVQYAVRPGSIIPLTVVLIQGLHSV